VQILSQNPNLKSVSVNLIVSSSLVLEEVNKPGLTLTDLVTIPKNRHLSITYHFCDVNISYDVLVLQCHRESCNDSDSDADSDSVDDEENESDANDDDGEGNAE